METAIVVGGIIGVFLSLVLVNLFAFSNRARFNRLGIGIVILDILVIGAGILGAFASVIQMALKSALHIG